MPGLALTVASGGIMCPPMALAVGETLVSSLAGLDGGYVWGKAVSAVKISSTATPRVTGVLTLHATGKEEVSDRALALTNSEPLAAGVVVRIIKETSVTVDVASGAVLSAGQDLVAKSTNAATVNVTAQSFSSDNTPAGATVAVSMVDLTTLASPAVGAVIESAGNISVIADTANSFSTSASSTALDNAKAGLPLAYSEIYMKALARSGGPGRGGESWRPVKLRPSRILLRPRRSQRSSWVPSCDWRTFRPICLSGYFCRANRCRRGFYR